MKRSGKNGNLNRGYLSFVTIARIKGVRKNTKYWGWLQPSKSYDIAIPATGKFSHTIAQMFFISKPISPDANEPGFSVALDFSEHL